MALLHVISRAASEKKKGMSGGHRRQAVNS